MRAKVFIDTNLFVYLQSTTNEEKKVVSQGIIDSRVWQVIFISIHTNTLRQISLNHVRSA